MAGDSPQTGDPTYDLSDMEDGEGEDAKPMMLGKTLSTKDITGDTVKPVKVKPNKSGSFMRYFRSKSVEEAPDVSKEDESNNGSVDGGERSRWKGPSIGSHFKKDWTKEQRVLRRIRTSAAGTLSTVGRGAAEGGAFLFEASKRTAYATAESIRKLKILPTPLDVLCKAECTARPCPRIILVCCTAIASRALEEENIFKEEAPRELVEALADHLHLGYGGVLPPQAASPHVLAAVVKHFLSELPEPLLTSKLVPDWIAAGNEPLKGRIIMEQLPEPNMNALDIILDTCHRIAGNSEVNNMSALALAEALVPSLAWRQQKTKTNPVKAATPLVSKFVRSMSTRPGNQQPSEVEDEVIQFNDPENPDFSSIENVETSSGNTMKLSRLIKQPLNATDTAQVVKVIGYMISEYRTL